MILHNGRCGSTVVGNLLAQNPNMHWASELYEPMFAKWKEENQQEFAYLAKEPIVENPIAILKNSMNEVTKPYYGFAIKPSQFCLVNSSATKFLTQSFLLNFTYFILIRRKNSLRQIVSDKVARKENIWHIHTDKFNWNIIKEIFKNYTAQSIRKAFSYLTKWLYRKNSKLKNWLYRKNSKLEKIHLPVNQSRPLVERIRGIERRMQEAESLLLSKNVLKLTYEDDIEQDPQSAYRSICEFVNMEPTKASVNLSKTNPFPLKDIIENFAEVKATLHNTPYEWMPNS